MDEVEDLRKVMESCAQSGLQGFATITERDPMLDVWSIARDDTLQRGKQRPMMNQVTPLTHLPERIRGLEEMAHNLWWSWHSAAQELFRALDLQAWRESGHNPVRMLALLPQSTLESAVQDNTFLANYDAVMQQFEAEIGSQEGWYTDNYGRPPFPLAYFSAEYGLHVSLPVYAGGLGILAGDYLKECSDLAIPVVAVGLIYSRGYVWQRIREDGWQEDVEQELDRTYDPISRVLDREGKPLTVQVALFDPPVHVAVWRANVGRVPLYLLDTDLDVNQPWDRAIAHHLYATDLEQRLRQEIVLGIGGMQVLEALGIHPAALHINEGHPGLAILERVRSLVAEGMGFDEASRRIRESTIFTTHTPMAAGTDVFPFQWIEKYFSGYYPQLGVDRDTLLGLGTHPDDPGSGFNMTVFALRMARFSNAVSQRHGKVARKMWAESVAGKKRRGRAHCCDHQRRSLADLDRTAAAAASLESLPGSRLDRSPGSTGDLGTGGRDSRRRTVARTPSVQGLARRPRSTGARGRDGSKMGSPLPVSSRLARCLTPRS